MLNDPDSEATELAMTPHEPDPEADTLRPCSPVPAAALQRVGPFTIERELARGGMGVVYVAVHPRLGRPVALKLLLEAEASEEERERFAIEARAAARLRHPNIVGIHTVGEHQGRPYLVMDLIEGESLQERIRREGPLPPREAATLTETLARALSYAHSRAILHRDLKPANVLLSRSAEPLITDFGLAKDVAAQDRGLTRTGQVMGTPAYMPPEQADGLLDQIDRRADIYALGATLYAMLTGRPPFSGPRAINILHQVLHDEPSPPRALRPELAIDLETICLTCLAKEPERRYDSAQQLADDLGRYLRDESIAARRPSRGERLRRWLRKNHRSVRAVAATAAAAALLLVGLSIGYLIDLRRQTRRATEASETAQRREAIATDALDAFVTRLDSWDLEPQTPLGEVRLQMLEAGVYAMEQISDAYQEEAPISRRAGRAHTSLARMALLAGLPETALHASERACAVFRRLRDEHPDRAEAQRDLAFGLEMLGQSQQHLGQHAEALASFQACYALRTRPEVVGTGRGIGQCLQSIAESLVASDRHDEAQKAAQEAVRVARTWLDADQLDGAAWLDLATALLHLGDLLRQAGDGEGAKRACAEAEKLAAEVFRVNGGREARQTLTTCLELRAVHEHVEGNLAAAQELLERVLVHLEQLLAADPGYGLARRWLAQGLDNLAMVVEEQGSWGAALALRRQALELRRELKLRPSALAAHALTLEPRLGVLGDPVPLYLERFLTVAAIARLHELLEQPEEALAARAEAIALRREQLPEPPVGLQRDWAERLLYLVQRCQESGARQASALFLREARRVYDDLAEADADPALRRELAARLHAEAGLLQELGNPEEALALYLEALQLRRALLHHEDSLLPPNAQHQERARRDLCASLGSVGSAHQLNGNHVAALALLEEALAIAWTFAGEPSAATLLGQALERLASLRQRLAQPEEAERLLTEALAQLPDTPSDSVQGRLRAKILHRLGSLLVARDDPSGRALLAEALRLRRALWQENPDGPNTRELARSLAEHGRQARAAGELDAARQFFAEAVDLHRELLASSPDSTLWRRALATTVYNLGTVHYAEGRYVKALALCRETVALYRGVVARDPDHAGELAFFVDVLPGLERLAGERAAVSPTEHLELAYGLRPFSAHRARAVASFQAALEDPSLRADTEGAHLFHAACTAADLTADGGSGTELALGWLEEDLRRRRTRIAALAEELEDPDGAGLLETTRGQLRDHLIRLRDDESLANLRALPGFEALLEIDAP